MEGKPIDWRQYLAAVKSFGDVLNKLGLGKETLPHHNRPRASELIETLQSAPLETSHSMN
jgi:hypothetical protein